MATQEKKVWGRKIFRKKEKGGAEEGTLRWQEPGEMGQNYTILNNILQ